jgi:hypothetical protein
MTAELSVQCSNKYLKTASDPAGIEPHWGATWAEKNSRSQGRLTDQETEGSGT